MSTDAVYAIGSKQPKAVNGWAVVMEPVAGDLVAVFWRAGTSSALDTREIASGRDVGAIAASTLIATIATGVLVESDPARWESSLLHDVNQALLLATAAALAAGAEVLHTPGLRPEYHESYYGAFVRDPDGNKLNAVCYAPE